MTDFVVTITDPIQLEGITWAREQYNASLPVPPPPPDTVVGAMVGAMVGEGDPMPAPLADPPQLPPLVTDQEYVQHVMEQAAISYADQKLRKEYQDNYESASAARAAAKGA